MPVELSGKFSEPVFNFSAFIPFTVTSPVPKTLPKKLILFIHDMNCLT